MADQSLKTLVLQYSNIPIFTSLCKSLNLNLKLKFHGCNANYKVYFKHKTKE